MRTVHGPLVVIGLVAPIWATVLLTQTTKFIACVGFRYEFDLAAVNRTDAPQLPSLRSFVLDFPSGLFVVTHCRLRQRPQAFRRTTAPSCPWSGWRAQNACCRD